MSLSYCARLIQDPPREDIPEVVRICRTAGIRFFMVTGYFGPPPVSNCRDFPSTAVFIARQCGIVRNQKVDDISDLSPTISSPVKVYDPEDTKRIVKSIALAGKDLPTMTDDQWEQVTNSFIPLHH